MLVLPLFSSGSFPTNFVDVIFLSLSIGAVVVSSIGDVTTAFFDNETGSVVGGVVVSAT